MSSRLKRLIESLFKRDEFGSQKLVTFDNSNLDDSVCTYDPIVEYFMKMEGKWRVLLILKINKYEKKWYKYKIVGTP